MRNKTKIFFITLVVIAIFIWAQVAQGPTADEQDAVFVYFFNVRQGDSILIQKGNFQILIDGGPDDSVLRSMGKIMPLTDKNIEILILTHPHADHIIGLNLVLERYQVKTIYYSGVLYDSNAYEEFLSLASQKNIQKNIAYIGESITPFGGATLSFLWPGENYKNKELSNLNNASTVNKFCYYEQCVLLTGDIETDEQSKMLDYFSKTPTVFHSEVLKLAHHGSKNGTSQKFLSLAAPKYAVISVGENNKFGHPNSSLLNMLSENNIKYFRTDSENTIEFKINKTGAYKIN